MKTILSTTLIIIMYLFLGFKYSPESIEPADNLIVTQEEEVKDIFYYVDSFCVLYSVPREYIIKMGDNESGWWHPDSLEYVRMCGIKGEDSRGDLQVNMKYYNGKTDRISLLEQGIKYYRYQYDRYGDWNKARFAYARGHYREPSTWKPIEKRFMNEFKK